MESCVRKNLALGVYHSNKGDAYNSNQDSLQ